MSSRDSQWTNMATETAEGESLVGDGGLRVRVLATIGGRDPDSGATPDGAWCLCADHPVIGRSRRGADLVVRDRRMSGRHSRVRRAGPAWEMLDLDSKNGTRVAGRRVRAAPLRPGTIVRLGDTLLRVEGAPTRGTAPSDETANRLAKVGRGCGVRASAEAVARFGERYHRHRAPVGPLVVVKGMDEVTIDGRASKATSSVEAWLEHARTGTLVVCAASELPGPTVERLRAALDSGRSLVVGHAGHASLPVDVDVAPLHERPDAILAALRTRGVDVSAGFADGLLHHDWPGGDDELAGTLDALPCGRRLRRGELPASVRTALARELQADDDAESRPERFARWVDRLDPEADALVFDASGGWLRAPGGPWVDVRRKPTQIAAIEVLAGARADSPGSPLDTHALFDALWPEAGGLTAATQNRVYKKLSLLRKLGLDQVLLRTEDGYALDPAVPLLYLPSDAATRFSSRGQI